MSSNFQLNPEHRSVTAICVVEDVLKCPKGYTPILRTHDQDADADLWKDGFFGRRITRYLCISKSQGRPEHVINTISVLHDKELPPEGFSLVQQTADTSQKAFQKKQIAFKVGHYRSNMESIVEIIILSKLRTPPDGFEYIGDINGMHFCVRRISALTRLNSPSLGYALSPNPLYPNMEQSVADISLSSVGVGGSGGNAFSSSGSASPSQLYGYNLPHQQPLMKQTNTLSQLSDVAGVPFVLHEDVHANLRNAAMVGNRFKPMINIKSESEIDNEYAYDFRTERDILITNGC